MYTNPPLLVRERWPTHGPPPGQRRRMTPNLDSPPSHHAQGPKYFVRGNPSLRCVIFFKGVRKQKKKRYKNVGVRGSLSRSISAPAHDERGAVQIGCHPPSLAGRRGGHRFSLDLVSEKRLGCVRPTTRSRNSIRVYLDRWRGLERSLEVCF